MPLHFNRVAVIGVGLIGGSLALAARRAGVFGEVVGVGRSPVNLEEARRRGIVDSFTHDPAEAVRKADLVLLAVPVRAMAGVVAQCRPVLLPGAVVTDVGSMKRYVLDTVEPLLPAGVRFVGAHPIAGTEASGAAAADPDLFRGRRCVLTPGTRSDPAALEQVRALWEVVGMRVLEMDADSHDTALAWVSHLPHVLAFSASRALERYQPDAARLAGPSFASLTRVAASHPETWVDIFIANRSAIARAVEGLVVAVEELRHAICTATPEELRAWLEESRQCHLRHLRASREEP
ncbi:MAG: prephenate dehydrogenase/arogenate dehydrogenase family protein [Candidatus Binatia bacterium]|nr:prephenate dehydrogenase/arogenate dehydrogenase family protein [Candidatus Binatia bacterium]